MNLADVALPKALTELKGVFQGCKSLKEIEIPESVTVIGYEAFCGCSNLEKIRIPDSVKKIGSAAFQSCLHLKSVIIPDTVESIDTSAFRGCRGLTDIRLPKSLAEIPNFAFLYCQSLRRIILPDSMKEIGSHAFDGCTGLEEIVLPDSLESIGRYAFYSCTSLKDVYIKNVWLLDKTGLGKDVKVIPTAAEGEELAKVQAPIEIGPMTFIYSGQKLFQSRIRPGDEVIITLLGAREYPGSLKAWNPVWEMDDSVSVIFEEYYFEVLVNGNKRYIGQSLIERYTESSTMGGGVRYHVERDRINADSQKQAMEKLVDWMESGRSANNDWHWIKSPDEVRDIPDGLPYYPR